MATLIKYIKKTKIIVEKLGDILFWPTVLLTILFTLFYKEITSMSFVRVDRVIAVLLIVMGIIVLASGIISFVKLIQRKNEKNN